jgi:molybdopterin-guanine dinucleotide biosynthesis protein A
MNNLEAFVLIGGRSSRLGQDKALLKIDGETFAQRAVNTISAALSPKQIYLVARDKNQFAAADLPNDVPVIYDRYKDRGAYGGLHAALSTANSEWVFVLACDLPVVSVDLLKYLAGLIDGAFDAIVAAQPDGRIQPLCAFYRTGPCLNVVEAMLKDGGKLPPLTSMFEKVLTRMLKYREFQHLHNSQNFFVNINTPEDLEAVRVLYT